MQNLSELSYWHSRSYGSAYRIQKSTLRRALICFCVVTPFTNWLIPFISMIIQEDLVVRYE